MAVEASTKRSSIVANFSFGKEQMLCQPNLLVRTIIGACWWHVMARCVATQFDEGKMCVRIKGKPCAMTTAQDKARETLYLFFFC
jgi:hypothetical protein